MDLSGLLVWAIDALLALLLLWLAVRALASPDLLEAVILFIGFGLTLAMVWVRLAAPDIALAEAAIGAGLTGALLLAALARLPAGARHPDAPGSIAPRRRLGAVAESLLLAALCAGLVLTILSLPAESPGLADEVTAALGQTGVTSPVTAVLLDFRGYDTLLEMAVLLLALVGVWSLVADSPHLDPRPGLMLDRLTRLYLPLMLVVAGYLLWAGGTAPGGAFQSGAVLGAAGVVLTLGGWRLASPLAGWPLRLILITGLVIFIAVGLLPIGLGSVWLDYPRDWAGALILLIETAASLSIGATLAALFLGGQPRGHP